jgi:hypothetical protein
MTDRATLFARLARLTVTTAGGDLARRLGAASQSILRAEGMAITVENASTDRVTLCATDQVVSRLEDLQDVIGEGPCLDAFRHNTYFSATIDGQPDYRWPEFSRAAWDAVGRRVQLYSFPMRPGGRAVGAASVYLTDGRELAETIENTQFIVDAVGAALVTDPAVESDDPGWSARAPVHQATGMVAAQLDLPLDDALAILRAHAYAANDTLAGAARQVLEREVDFRTDP